MVSFDNSDLYQIVLDRLRKDRKGGVSPEEFESFLRLRNIDYFNQQFKVDGVSQINTDSLSPFAVFNDPEPVTQDGAFATYYVTPDATYTHLINAFHSASNTSYATVVELDIVSNAELNDRLNNAITGPSATEPIGYLSDGKLWVYGVTTGYILLSYYKYPADPYFDYYTDASGNVTYLTDGQAEYTLQAGEISRSGLTAGAGVTSVSEDLEWGDQDAMNILDMVMTDVGVAQSDQGITQTSVIERQQNVKS